MLSFYRIVLLSIFFHCSYFFAAEDQEYLFLFFYKEKTKETILGEQILQQTLHAINTPVSSRTLQIGNPQNADIVAQYQVQRAPMPLVLVIAPNGAITGGFPFPFTLEQLESAVVSPVMSEVLAGLQDHKLIFLAIQNSHTHNNKENLLGVEAFRDDSHYYEAVRVLYVDPTDPQEGSLLQQFGINPHTREAIVVFLAPPGKKIAAYTGMTTKEQILNDLQNASSCCPGGSCPGGRCG
jgi:hypothetical protein